MKNLAAFFMQFLLVDCLMWCCRRGRAYTKAEGRRQKAEILAVNVRSPLGFLPSDFCLLLFVPRLGPPRSPPARRRRGGAGRDARLHLRELPHLPIRGW